MIKKKRGKSNFRKNIDNSSILRNYPKCFSYLWESLNYFYIIAGIFLFFIFIGAAFHVPILVNFIQDFLKELLLKTENFGVYDMVAFLFNNNLRSAFFGLVFGIFLGIFSVINAAINGYVIGYIMSKTVEIQGVSILLRLFPHGIFEIPALIMSLGLGLKLGMFIFSGKNSTKELKRRFIEGLRVFLYIIIPLLVIAAIIEGILMFILP